MDEVHLEKLKEVMSDIDRVEKQDLIEKILKENKAEFEFEGTTYCVTPPTYDHKAEANKERVKKFNELLKDETFLLEDDLIKLYQKRGVDIKAIDKDILALDKHRDDLLFKLGEALKKDETQGIDSYKKEIEALNADVRQLTTKKIMYLESSIESQVMVHLYTYIAYLCTTKKVGDTYVKAFNSFDEFKTIKSDLMNLIVFYTSCISRNELKL